MSLTIYFCFFLLHKVTEECMYIICLNNIPFLMLFELKYGCYALTSWHLQFPLIFSRKHSEDKNTFIFWLLRGQPTSVWTQFIRLMTNTKTIHLQKVTTVSTARFTSLKTGYITAYSVMDTMEFVSASFFISSIVILQGGAALGEIARRKLELTHTHTYTHPLTLTHTLKTTQAPEWQEPGK